MSLNPCVEQSSEGPGLNPGGITGSALPKRGVKRKLDNKSIETKYQVLVEVEKGQKTKKQIADQYGLAKSTLSTWVKNAEEIKNAYLNADYSAKRKKMRTASYPEVEDALLKWFKATRDRNIPVSGPLMMAKADEFATRLGIPDGQFKCSSGWLERFKERHGISFKRVCGEEKSVDVNSDQMEEWRGTLKVILEDYRPEDIYNADETAIFYRCMPDRTLEFKNVDCHGGKMSKERLTALVCANMTGSDRVPLLVLGKSAKPRCFKNVKSLPTQYESNKKAWMTSALFTNWLLAFDRKCQKQRRRVAMVVDNCPAHPKVKGLKAVTLFFLPPNTTSRTQPMDQGVIRTLKHRYRNLVIGRHLRAIEKKEQVQLNVLDALYYLKQAWMDVTQSTIVNCYAKAGFRHADATSCDNAIDFSTTDDDDPMDDLPLASLLGGEVSMAQYVDIDDSVPTCGDISEESIVEDIISSRTTTSTVDEEEDNNNIDDAPPVIPPLATTFDACTTLRNFLQSQPDAQDVITKLADIEKYICRIDISRRCAQQKLITDMFSMK